MSITPRPMSARPSFSKPEAPKPEIVIPVRSPRPLVPRIVMYAAEKFGKTTFASYAPEPIILMCKDNGYDTLLSSRSVPAVPAAEMVAWEQLLDTVRHVANTKCCKTLIIDGITGAERLCHEYVVANKFEGKWGEDGFLAYHKGYSVAVTDWLKLLAALDEVRQAGITVVLLGHARTRSVKNPMGADYDRFEPDVHQHTWGPTAKWADAILFGKFHTIVEVAKREQSKKMAEQKGKAIGGTQRVIFTEPHDAWVAGNRFGMESEIWLNGQADGMWSEIVGQFIRTVA
jgi:hypothetical protein